MTDTKFTPAPWDCHPSAFMADGDDKRAYFIVSGIGFSGKADANAKLISAAPDLFEAASNLLSRLDLDKDVKDNAWWKDERESIAAALAKARGETKPKTGNQQ